MPSPKPKVTIIILNWNGAHDTLAVLKNLAQVTYPNFSIMVVDNGSHDDSVDKINQEIKHQPTLNISILPLPHNYGYAEGNNKGLTQAKQEKSDYYLLLNNDTVLSPDFLDKMVAALEANPKLGAVGPTIYFATPNGQKQDEIWYAGGWLNFAAGGAHHKTALPSQIAAADKPISNQPAQLIAESAQVEPTQFITGCCFLIRAEAIRKLGTLFDPQFFAYGEDVDLCQRLVRAGYQLGYVPQARIWHKLASSSGGPKSSNFWYYNVRNNFLIVARYGRWFEWPLFILFFLFYKPVLWSVAGAILKPRRDKWFRLIAIVQGTSDAIRGRYGQRSSDRPQ